MHLTRVAGIRKCWASGYATWALQYRRRAGLPLHAHDLAVGVMELVDVRSAGVVFTLDPVTGDRDRMVVEANWGFGESVVSGQVTPDYWAVDRASGRIGERRVGGKHMWTVFDLATAKVVPMPLPEIESLAAKIKKRCGSGGTVRDGVIEIQGDHRDAIVAELTKLGWPAKKSGG